MDEELKAIIQRMVDAKESEENIAIVIQGWKPKKSNEVSTKGSKNTSGTSTEPSRISQQANPFGAPTQTVPTINVATGKTGTTKVTTGTKSEQDLKRAEKLASKGTDMMNSLSIGVNKMYSGLAKLPRYVYEVPESLLNILADAVENNAGVEAGNILRPTQAGNYDALLAQADKVGVAGMSPLTMIDKAGTYFDKQASDYEKKAVKYDEDIVGSLGSGKFSDAGAQVVNNIVGSVPAMLEMYMTGGAGKALKLPTVARTTLTALPFASSKANEIRDNPDIPNSIKPLYSLANGFTEVVFDQSFGTQAILNKITKTLTESGEKEALKIAKDVTKGYFTNAFAKIKEPVTDLAKNSIEEMSTRLSQNILKYVVEDRNTDLMEGVLDDGIVGGVTGVALSSVNTVLKPKEKESINSKNTEIENLNLDLDNPNIPNSTKQVIEKTILQKKNEVVKEIEKSKEEFDKLDEKQKEKSLEISAEINDIETALEQEGISPTAKATLEEQKVKLEEQLSKIKPVEQSKPKTDAEYFDVYKDAVDKAETFVDAYAEVSKNGQVLSDTFNQQYNPDGTLTPLETFRKFYNEVKQTTQTVPETEVITPTEEVVPEPVVKPKFTIKGDIVTPKIEVVDVANPVIPEQTGELVQKKRASVQRVLKSSEYSQAFKDSLGEQTISYTELPNKITERDAQAFIDINGEAETIKSLYDFNNGIKSAVRFTVMQRLIDNYEEAGDYVKAGELAQELYSKGTDYGQGIQIFSTFPKLAKQSQIAIAEKNANNQREISKKLAKPTTDKIVKDFKEINKQTAEEVVAKVTKKVNEVLNTKPAVSDVAPKDYGSKNKIVTKDKYKEALKNLRKKSFAFAGGVPLGDLAVIAGYHLEASSRDFAMFSKRMVSDVGTKIRPYLKELYAEQRDLQVKEGGVSTNYLTDKEIDSYLGEQDGTTWKKKFDQAVKKADIKSEKIKSEAIAKLQQISKEEGLWGKYKESAATRLKGVVKTNIQKEVRENPSLEQFTTDLVRNMRAKMVELLPETTKKKTTPRPDLEVLADAYKNFEKYEDVWEATQEQFKEKFADQPEVLENLDRYFGEILDKPFNEKLINRTVNKGLKDMGKNINDLIVQHYTVLDGTRQDLADKLVEQAGLTGTQAKALSDAVQKEFDRIATQKKQQALEKIFSKKERRKPAVKTLEGEIIRMSNLGAFTNNDIVDMYGDKMGWAKLTDEQRQKIGELADIVQNTKDSIAKRRATEDLLAYQALLKGNSTMDLVTSIWYANVLSGYNTQIVNFGANAINTALLYANAVVQTRSPIFLARGLAGGIKRGLLEAKETVRSGYSPIKGAPEVPTLLELKKFVGGMKNPLSWLKYVRRIMIAADVIFFEGQKEMRAYQLAKQQASNEGKIDPTLNQINRAIELLGKNDEQLARIKERVELEYQEEQERIEQSDLTPKEKVELKKLSESDKQRKMFDYIERERPTDMVEETSTYAARGTYNYKPQGALGAFAKTINEFVSKAPLFRFVIPFTNIIANVANETIDYTPVGFIRSARASSGGGIFSSYNREALTPQQKVDLTTKAAMGTTLMTLLLILSSVPMGEDDEPLIEITANGTGEYSKNEALRETGWQPYSIRVKLPNGKKSAWVSYQYSPLILALGFVGHFNDLRKYKDSDDKTWDETLSKAASLVVSTFGSTTYLTGLSDFLQSVLDPKSSGSFVNTSIKAATGIAKGIVVPNLITQTQQKFEEIFDVPKKEIKETWLGSVLQDIPVARNLYGDKVNILGDPVMYDLDKFTSFERPNKIIKLLVDKKSVFAPPSRKAEKTYDIETGKERMLNDEEFYIFARTKGQAIKTELEERFDELDKLSVGAFKKELTKIKTQATKDARAKISTGESSLFEIKGKEDGKNVTFKLTPQLVKERIKLNEDYIKTEGKKELQLYIDEYVNLDKIPLKKATEKAKLDIQKNANKYSANVFLDRVEAGKLTLDIKE